MATTESHATRNTARALIANLGALPAVVGTDLLAPTAGSHDGWTVEATLETAMIPAAVSREIGRAGASLDPQPPQGDHAVVVAVI